MTDFFIAPSILSADFARLGEEGEATSLRDALMASRVAERPDMDVRAGSVRQGRLQEDKA